MDRGIYADRVRTHALHQYIEPARRRHDSTVRIVAGDVQKAVRLSNRISLVCNALKSRKFLEGNRLTLEKCEGPPSGMSTTVAFTYRLDRDVKSDLNESTPSFLQLRGVAKEVFQKLGGGEAFVRSERKQFYGSEPKE